MDLIRSMLTGLLLAATAMAARAEDFNDYPTSARSEYVFGCLKANGETRQAIGQCSCQHALEGAIATAEAAISPEARSRLEPLLKQHISQTA